MPRFRVTLMYPVWAHATVDVEAENHVEAMNKALDDAPNADFDTSDDGAPAYEVEGCEELPELTDA